MRAERSKWRCRDRIVHRKPLRRKRYITCDIVDCIAVAIASGSCAACCPTVEDAACFCKCIGWYGKISSVRYGLGCHRSAGTPVSVKSYRIACLKSRVNIYIACHVKSIRIVIRKSRIVRYIFPFPKQISTIRIGTYCSICTRHVVISIYRNTANRTIGSRIVIFQLYHVQTAL